jgi:GxxExxY protein
MVDVSLGVSSLLRHVKELRSLTSRHKLRHKKIMPVCCPDRTGRTENRIGKVVIDSTIAVHNAFGSGLYEIVYKVVLTHKLKKHVINVERQFPVSIEYDGIKFDEGFRADIIIENKVTLELKSVKSVTKAHKKQVLTYPRLTECKLSYLLNFGGDLMKEGISRIINAELEERQSLCSLCEKE